MESMQMNLKYVQSQHTTLVVYQRKYLKLLDLSYIS